MLILLLACSAPDAPIDDSAAVDPGWDAVFDWETLCRGTWPENDCADGCADAPVEQTYEAGFYDWASDSTGFSTEELGDHVRLREVDTWLAEQSSQTTVDYLIRVGWVEMRVYLYVDAAGGDPTANSVAVEYARATFAQPHWNGAVRPFEDIAAELAACEETYHAEFPETDWCDGWVSDDPSDDQTLRYSFSAPTTPGKLAFFIVSPDGSEPGNCGEEDAYEE